MGFGFFIRLLLYLIVIQLSVTMLAYLLLRGKRNALLYSFAFIQFITVFWMLRAVFAVLAGSYITDPEQLNAVFGILSWKLGIFNGGFLALAWLIFCLNYSGWKPANYKIATGLVASPIAILFLIALTNDWHRLFMRNMLAGPFFWVHAVIAYSYSVAGFFLLIKYAVNHKGHERKRTILLFLAFLLPFAVSLTNDIRMQVFMLRPLGAFDVNSVSFSIGTMLVAFIIYKYRFLNIYTVALRMIVNNQAQAVIIVDGSNNVVGINDSFDRTFLSGWKLKPEDNISAFTGYLEGNSDEGGAGCGLTAAIKSRCDNWNGELKMTRPEVKYFSVVITPISKGRKNYGRIIAFNDITPIRTMMEELELKNKALTDLNNELIDKNRQLHDYARTVSELAAARERNRITRDMHDTLGQTMTVLVTQLNALRILCGKEPDKARERIGELVRLARNGLDDIKRSITGLMPEKVEETSLEAAVRRLTEDFEAAGIKTDLAVNGSSEGMDFDYFLVIYRLCQEALTNSVRHGNAEHAEIMLDFSGDKVRIRLQDDGCGCGNISKDFGLRGMEERVKSLGGHISYWSDKGKGFKITVELPPFAAQRRREGGSPETA
jgi:signal transduction histidine kinase